MYYSEMEFLDIVKQVKAEEKREKPISLWTIIELVFYIQVGLIFFMPFAWGMATGHFGCAAISAFYIIYLSSRHNMKLILKLGRTILSKLGITVHANKSFTKRFSPLFKWEDFNLSREEFAPHFSLYVVLCFVSRLFSHFVLRIVDVFNPKKIEGRYDVFENNQYDFNNQVYFQNITYHRHFLVFFIPHHQDIQKEKIENLAKTFERKVEYLRYSQKGTLIVLSRTKDSSFKAFSNWFYDLASIRRVIKQKQVYKEIKAIADLIS